MQNKILDNRLKTLESKITRRGKGLFVMVQESDVDIEAAKQRVLKEKGLSKWPENEYAIIFDLYGKPRA